MSKKVITIGTVGYGYGAFLHVNGYMNAGQIPIRLKTVCARNAEKAEEFRARGWKAYGLQCDLGDHEALCRGFDEALDLLGGRLAGKEQDEQEICKRYKITQIRLRNALAKFEPFLEEY